MSSRGGFSSPTAAAQHHSQATYLADGALSVKTTKMDVIAGSTRETLLSPSGDYYLLAPSGDYNLFY